MSGRDWHGLAILPAAAVAMMEEEEDADQLPLMGASRPIHQQAQGLGVDAGPDEDSLESPGWFLWALSLSAAISGLLFGYE